MSRHHVATGPGFVELDTDWMDDAACARESDLPWTGGAAGHDGDLMCAICAACPVRVACAEFALAAEVTAGWWAGRSFNRTHRYKPLPDEVPRRGDAA